MDAPALHGPAHPEPVAFESTPACPGSGTIEAHEVQAAFIQLQQRFPRTEFKEAWAACAPGLIAVRLSNGELAYTDKSGRYLILGLVFDSATGQALDRQLDPIETERP